MNPKVIEGISPKLDADMLTVMKNMPAWTPATIGTTPIDKQFLLPMSFWITNVPMTETGMMDEKK